MTARRRVMVVGLGHVGRALLAGWDRVQGPVRLVAAADSRGLFHDEAGLDPEAVRASKALPVARRGYTARRRGGATTADWVARVAPEVLVELSCTDLAAGEPAVPDILAALDAGAHVVTSAKSHHADLRRLRSILDAASRRGLLFLDHASMLAGIPATEMAAGTGMEVDQVEGVLNGTTNFILSRMEQGEPFARALALARRLGYTERDPRYDLEGHDVALKLAGLARVFLGRPMGAGSFRLAGLARGCKGITGLDPDRVRRVLAEGRRIKLVGRVWRSGGRVRGEVGPRELPAHSPYARVEGFTNALSIQGHMNGTAMELFLTGPGAGADQTASRVLGNLNEVLRLLDWREHQTGLLRRTEADSRSLTADS